METIILSFSLRLKAENGAPCNDLSGNPSGSGFWARKKKTEVGGLVYGTSNTFRDLAQSQGRSSRNLATNGSAHAYAYTHSIPVWETRRMPIRSSGAGSGEGGPVLSVPYPAPVLPVFALAPGLPSASRPDPPARCAAPSLSVCFQALGKRKREADVY